MVKWLDLKRMWGASLCYVWSLCASSVPWSKSNMANQDGLDATQMMNSRISLVASGDRILKSIVTHMSIVKYNI